MMMPLTLQVRLMNFSTKGNDSLTKWGVFPAGSTDLMPNATAMVT